MKIAVVILNWNGVELLKKFLPSVVEYSKQANIYLVDNASTDASLSYVKKHYPTVNCILNSSNRGYAGGYNEGLKTIEEDIYILLNNDVEVSKNWLIPIIECFKANPEISVIQPKILDYNHPEYFEYAGAAGGFIDKYGYPFCRGRIFDTIEKDDGQYDDDCKIFWASGACLAIRKQAFRTAGEFDESYFAHQEEIDLCWRIHNLDQVIWYCHNSKVYHLGGGTLDTLDPKKTFLNFRNSLYNILKNVNSPDLYSVLFVRLILDGLACFKFLYGFKLNHITAVFKAHFSFYSNYFLIGNKRKDEIVNPKYYTVNSIIKEYFFIGNKRFTELRTKK